MAPYLRVRRVDERGVALLATGDRPVDLCVDGRRIWTFWSARDTESVGVPGLRRAWPLRRAPWPQGLAHHMVGRARITVRDPASDRVYFDRDLQLGESEAPIVIRSRRGVELGIDKSGRLVPTFEGRSRGDIDALLDATEKVLAALRDAGVEPFLAYGTLLGAVREGRVLGHDSDADLGYVSRHSTPVDVVRESFEVQRQLARAGFRIARYSGGSFKILVTEAEVTRGLDVFGGFLDGGRLHLMGEIDTPFEEDWILPLGEAPLNGRPMPVPARPEKLLAATYGPGWQVPDPAFKFTTPERTVRAFNDWFRGTQPGIRHWDRRAAFGRGRELPDQPTPLARRAARAARRIGGEVLEVGAGRGSDSLWIARQGLAVTAYDYAPQALALAEQVAQQESVELVVRQLNLTEWRSVLAEGARLAQVRRPRVVLARHVLEATSTEGRAGFARLCSMALRDGGRVLAECYLPPEEPAPGAEADEGPEWMVGPVDPEETAELFRAAGAQRVIVKRFRRGGRPAVRLLGVW